MSKLNMYKLIKKYQYGDTIGMAEMTAKNNLYHTKTDEELGLHNMKNLGESNAYRSNVAPSQFGFSNSMDFNLMSDIEANNRKLGINPDGTTSQVNNPNDPTAIKPQGVADKTKFMDSTLGKGVKMGANMLWDSREEIGAGIDSYAESQGHETNFMDTGMKATGNAMLKSGTPWGAAAGAATLAAQKVGEFSSDQVQGFSGNTGSAGYADMSMQDKSFSSVSDYLIPGSGLFSSSALSEQYADQVKKQQSDYTQAQNVVDRGKDNALAAEQSQADLNIKRRLALSGINTNNVGRSLMAKDGGVIKKINVVIIDNLKEGGSIIPSGALHARKNNLNDKELNGNITNKGVPVISKDKDVITQHAEVEKEELILTLDITEKIQKLWKVGTDEAMIEAGKILAEELMTNTEDRVGIIDKTIKDENKNKNK